MAKKVVKPEEGAVVGGADAANVPATPSKKSKDVTKVLFTRKDGTTREFSEDVHGEGFVALADEFGATNEKFIASRKDL